MNDVENAKVIFLGESYVGKTEISRLVNDSPICFSYVSKVLEFNEFHKSIKFDFWDTAGQEKSRTLLKISCKKANIIVFVYDITYKKSFEAIKYWQNDVQSYCESDSILEVVGNRFNEEKSQKKKEENLQEVLMQFFN